MSKIAYIRVSSKNQNVGRRHQALSSYKIDCFFEEKISGKDMNRPELKGMMDWVREGDTVYVESFSRLARVCCIC
ncbi:recombinase family protein [Propionispira raffinosivorans]|uniref:recombinase family protein n=1 Tax=Propionispira raffinosivorans TaxID=86959 RepID=UPI000372CF89|nr:recombinase family protein [Propionispira raffinosivorans]